MKPALAWRTARVDKGKNSCALRKAVILNKWWMKNFRTKISQMKGTCCGLLYCWVARSRTGLFLREWTCSFAQSSPFYEAAESFQWSRWPVDRFISSATIDTGICFSFVFTCHKMFSRAVIKWFSQIMILGLSSYIHSDRGSCLVSEEIQNYLYTKGSSTSQNIAYNHQTSCHVQRWDGPFDEPSFSTKNKKVGSNSVTKPFFDALCFMLR